jgi:hypothetical protein
MTYLWISFLIEDRQNACQLSYILDKEYKKGQRGINSFSFELFYPYLFFKNHFSGQHGSWIGIYLCHKCLSLVGAKRSTQGKAQLCRKVTDKQTFFHTMWYRSTPC